MLNVDVELAMEGNPSRQHSNTKANIHIVSKPCYSSLSISSFMGNICQKSFMVATWCLGKGWARGQPYSSIYALFLKTNDALAFISNHINFGCQVHILCAPSANLRLDYSEIKYMRLTGFLHATLDKSKFPWMHEGELGNTGGYRADQRRWFMSMSIPNSSMKDWSSENLSPIFWQWNSHGDLYFDVCKT